MGTLLTVVGGCSRSGAAAISFSQRSWAAVSVTVAMITSTPIQIRESFRVNFLGSIGACQTQEKLRMSQPIRFRFEHERATEHLRLQPTLTAPGGGIAALCPR